MFPTNKTKAEAIFELNGMKHDPACKSMVKLLDILIDEVRIQNDEAPAERVLGNQGEIRAFMRLKEYIEKGLPTTR